MNATRNTPAIFFLALLLTNMTVFGAVSRQNEQLEATGSAAPKDVRLPKYYPASFQNKGTIQRVDGDTLVIGGVRYRLLPDVKVHTLDRESAPSLILAEGQEIGFTLGPIDQRGRTIAEIWVLPAGTIPLH